MTQTAEYSCDVFVDYTINDRVWVHDTLMPSLLIAGMRVFADHRIAALDAAAQEFSISPISSSRVVLLVLSAHTGADRRAHFERLLERLERSAGSQPHVVAALLGPYEQSEKLARLSTIDFTKPAGHARQMRRLLRRLGRKCNTCIVYQRDTEADVALASDLAALLARAGHNVERSKELLAEEEWVVEAKRQIATSDYVVALLSAAAAQSELVASQIEFAHRQFLEHGRPRILPVRLDYADRLPYQLGMYLDRLPAAEWHSRADTRRLLVQLCDAIGHATPLAAPFARRAPWDSAALPPPPAKADPRFVEALDAPQAPMRPDAASYVERESDLKLRRVLRSVRGVTATIRAPGQTGKTSLLVRGLAQIQSQGGTAVFVDLKSLDPIFSQSLDDFLRYLAATIVDRFVLDKSQVDAHWSRQSSPSYKLTSLLESFILPQVETKLTLAIDEADRLLNAEYSDVFFGLLRSWHNNRARNQLWEKLDLLMVIATEPYLLIRDHNQSPFNVGETIELEDFDVEQIAELNLRYLSPLSQRELPDLLALLGGHPYLTSRALYAMRTEGLTWAGLRRVAASDRGPFGDHLRQYIWMLSERTDLRGAIKEIVERGKCSDERLFFRLVQAGLAKGVDASACALRCMLYEMYFGEKLR